jgi:glycine/D-amino acid oxidase-like deaminating enzyme
MAQLTTDFAFRPYWWDLAPPRPGLDRDPEPEYEVAIVGSGFTGASAALHLARAGMSVAVFEKGLPGEGASRRNAGFVGRVLKKTFSEIADKSGEEAARTSYGEAHRAYRGLFDFAEREGIDCFATRRGRFVAARSPKHLAELERDLARMRDALGHDFEILPRERQREEIGSDLYHGGAVIPDSGAVHPGLLHEGLAARAVEAGAHVFGNSPVSHVEKRGGDYALVAGGRRIVAKHVVIATNGYTEVTPWHRRRVVPFRAFMAATQELPADLMAEILPKGRTVIDSNVNIDYFRPAPDSPRLLFGGATAEPLSGPEEIAGRMHALLRRAFPQLSDIQLARVWDGYCAGTFDMKPHVGRRGNEHYAMGYNFAGVAMGTAFGERVARTILGETPPNSVFAGDRFPTVPFYSGNPWFLGAVRRYIAWKDVA